MVSVPSIVAALAALIGMMATLGGIIFYAGRVQGTVITKQDDTINTLKDILARLDKMEGRTHNLEQAIIARGISLRGVRVDSDKAC